MIATDQRFPDRIGEIYHLAYNAKQKWLWTPNMKDNEILLLKGWDSSNNIKIPRCTPHTSFNLQGQNIKKNPRESIEARIFMVLKNETKTKFIFSFWWKFRKNRMEDFSNVKSLEYVGIYESL